MNSVNQRTAELSPEKRKLLESRLLQKFAGATKTVAPLGRPNAGPRPLSFVQESLWFFDQLKPNSPLYNIPQAFRLQGNLQADLLQKSFQTVVARHAALRATFSTRDGKPVQEARESVS